MKEASYILAGAIIAIVLFVWLFLVPYLKWYYRKKHTIERIDSSKGYTKDNVRWTIKKD